MTGKSEKDVEGGADRRELYGHFKTAADPQNQAVPDHRSHGVSVTQGLPESKLRRVGQEVTQEQMSSGDQHIRGCGSDWVAPPGQVVRRPPP